MGAAFRILILITISLSSLPGRAAIRPACRDAYTKLGPVEDMTVSEHLEAAILAANIMPIDISASVYYLKAALEHEPTNRLAQILIASAYYREGNFPLAIEHGLLAESIDPTAHENLRMLFSSFMNEGRYAEANAAASRYLKIRPTDIYAFKFKILALVKLRKKTDASLYIDQMLTMKPELNFLKDLATSVLAFRGPSEAYIIASRGLERFKDDPRLTKVRSKALSRMNDTYSERNY